MSMSGPLTSMLALRPASLFSLSSFAQTSMSNNPSHAICIRHPAYPAERNLNVLIILQAYDHPDGGLHHETARIACGIIAGNSWDGYFTLTPGGPRLDIGRDDLLRVGRDYYFHVPPPGPTINDAPYRYPICPTFRHWIFPHDNLPPTWIQPTAPMSSTTVATSAFPVPQAPSALSSAVVARDVSCRMSGCRDGVGCAHLCPRQEEQWFLSNRMAMYNLNRFLPSNYLIDDLYNAITLRSDLHGAFDRRIFAIVPKSSATLSEDAPLPLINYVVHVLQPTNEIGPVYHNAAIQPTVGIRAEFLLARFAWAIFPLLAGFLVSGCERSLILVDGTTTATKQATADESYAFANANSMQPPKSRSNSPRKRRAVDSTTGNNGDNDNIDDDDSENSQAHTTLFFKRQRLNNPPISASPTSKSLSSTSITTNNNATPPKCYHQPLAQHSGGDDLKLPPQETPNTLHEVYPGFLRLDHLRQAALKQQRPPGWEFNPGKYERGSPKWLKEMGYEVQDYDDFDDGKS